jgi:hypothetical protein
MPQNMCVTKNTLQRYKKICTFATIPEENLQITALFVPEYMPAPA